MNAASRAASISAVIALVLAAVWLFWPSALGGGTTYVTTHGISMEPGFHTGDLAILRPADGYAVGDVVAYYSPALDTIVMHRIVAEESGRFVLQGDNNDWLDGDEPLPEEILGKLFVRIPRGGIALDGISSPGALVFLVGGLLTVFGTARRPRGRRDRLVGRRRGVRRREPGSAPAFPMPIRARARQIALGSGVLALVAVVGGGVLLVLPSNQTGTRTLQVTQQGEFSYTAAAVPGTTYPSGVVATGDTVWTRLAEQVTVTFTTAVAGPDVTDVRGSMRLDVVITAADGWTAVLTSGPEAALENGTAAASVAVDPAAAAALLSRHYIEIGGTGAGATLTVTPVVAASGRAEGRPFTAGSPTGFAFALDAASLRPTGELATTATIPVEIEEVVPRRLTVLDVTIPIDVLRWGVAGVLAVALVVLAAAAWIGRTGRGDAADQVLVRHADRILPVAAFTPGPTVIDVSDAESLRRVAERFDTLVLHHAAEDEDVFVVRDVDATYRLVIPGTPGRRRGKPPVPGRSPGPMDVAAPLPMVVQEQPESTTPLPLIAVEPPDLTSPMPLVSPLSRPSADGRWSRVA